MEQSVFLHWQMVVKYTGLCWRNEELVFENLEAIFMRYYEKRQGNNQDSRTDLAAS